MLNEANLSQFNIHHSQFIILSFRRIWGVVLYAAACVGDEHVVQPWTVVLNKLQLAI